MAFNPYLFLYNTALVLGWGYCLYLTVETIFIKHGSTADLWKVVETPLKVSQTAAVMEVVHSAVGLVRSPVAITGMQVASRLWIVWGIINLAPGEATRGSVMVGPKLPLPAPVGDFQPQLSLTTLLLAWSVTEVIRYGFFAVKEVLGSVPYPVLWLRYTTFIPLYPLGVASELTMVRLALPAIRSSRVGCIDMPNSFNFGFDYWLFCLLVVAGYIPGLPQLYLYMLAQRKKVLSGGAGSNGSAAATADRKKTKRS
ncbi:hypothetical protein VOLCADRAFT_83422 [Volvox carteri f. nagariensis]|uniref:Very-long-chain (3R)-3-hydroxyacyl-CoA dehydratase n=1 Tax=Volvox carteri f. nagariensis TaxID=3068 RepID=D8UBK0_VOLCA|nr:uncharacterized protein VOLCADRAFT_83422 [Volvox carteri f. nagariensis]EFJ42903.1 hypothetical protein VOLCADRAFT_83422 [Volvox carteri f. nagariensis]|eukprot:XP_002955943.1 hypothetical protein VOLCADRAFT_83422 [Volvox carteri f. nagariensis]